MIDLATTWYVIIGVLLAGYAVLDGFDLGVGILSPFVARSAGERGHLMESIGPVWDGNEVWLLTLGGALFAAFPSVYATVFSGFYLALMLLLLALILRAVAMEFRHHLTDARWQSVWDGAFSLGSFLAALLLGVAIGNIARGLPFVGGEYSGGLLGLLNPFGLLVGLMAVAMFALQGANWLVLRTSGRLASRARHVARVSWLAFGGLWLLVTAWSVVDAPGLWANYGSPLTWLMPIAFVLVMGFTGWKLLGTSERWPIVGSSLAIIALVGILGQGLYPALVPDRAGSADMTAAGTASSDLSLTVMLIIVVIGLPLVIAYTAFVYSRFTHKLEPTDSYG